MDDRRRHDVIAIGESLGLMVAAHAGRLRNHSDMQLGFGGAESNVAIGVSRLGGAAVWAGRVGSDAIGALILRELRAENVAVYPTLDPSAATALMLKERPFPGKTRVTYYRRGHAGSHLSPTDLPADAIADAQVLHVTGISAGLSAHTRSAAHAAIDHAHAAGTLVSFDVNHRASLWDDEESARDAYLEIAARADIVFAGDDEALLLTGEASPDNQLAALLRMGAAHAVVKLGERGAIAASADGVQVARDAVRVSVVDTVGAGDAFVAGWLTEFTAGADASARLGTAVACGAFACTGEGDWEAAASREDLAWLGADGGDPVIR